ncbi:hypothetical protein [Chlamydia felis Fe/C-56]|uniref:Secreted protein n=1 Tax=Chlamydia felis (strain Fe/C-56) TaxID=264202 RepID=Q255F8_CHLFF|nr:hypothetical protein [Chlamydia felis]BAE81080.1 hypothetical protein [Chlamydia felis Fe/C-56]
MKKYLIYSLTVLLCCSNVFAEHIDTIVHEPFAGLSSRVDYCFDSISDEDKEALTERIDSLFLVLVEEGQDLYRDLALICKNKNLELENCQQAVELMKETPSGQRILQACKDIFFCLQLPDEEINNENLSFNILLQKLDELT